MKQNQENKNLDSVICKIGYQIAEKILQKKEESVIEKALGVLNSDGVYAYYVYIKSKGVDNILLDEISDLMKYTDTKLTNKNYKEYFEELSNNLYDLLFFKGILEQTLTYARYHLKAREKNE
jgi:hypothetical protein